MHLFEVERPQVVLEVAGRRVESEVLASYRENPNFTELVQHVTVVRRSWDTGCGQKQEAGSNSEVQVRRARDTGLGRAVGQAVGSELQKALLH